MTQSTEKARVLEEISRIPEERLPDIYRLLHDFRLSLEASRGETHSLMRFAGCWQDMPDQVFDRFVEELAERRRQAFSGRRIREAGTD
jgi:hypothetical protein